MNNNDKRIQALMSKIEKQKNNLGKRPRVSLNTNGIFKYDDRYHFNINTVSNPTTLVEALSFLLEKKVRMTEAAKILDVDDFKVDWQGYPISDWEHDFKLRVKVLQWEKEQKKLKTLQNKLDGLISEDAKTQMALDEITKMLE